MIDLNKRYGHQYKITKDEAASRKVDPMYWIIPCKYGEIFPYGGDYFAVMVTSIKLANKLRNWKELEVTQDGSDAVIFKFHVSDFEKVAKRVVAKKKRARLDSDLSNLKKA